MNSSAPIVHVVDDDDSVRTAVARLLRAAGYEVQVHFTAGDFLFNRQPGVPGCAILDVRMPGPSGLELQDAIATSAEPLPVIFLTGHGDIPMSVRAMKAGAVDFLTKPVNRSVLVAAVEAALKRDLRSRSTDEKARCYLTRLERLSPRELAVFDSVVRGLLNKQIAADLGITERTVKAHRARVMEKMKAQSLAELVHMADALGHSALTD
jgi:FixJ family two-component response regulator